MSVDKEYCMSSYLALRYIVDPNKDFFKGMKHSIKKLPSSNDLVIVSSPEDVDMELMSCFNRQHDKRLGILLSGGMDSAVLASYMPRGSIAYTFRFLNGMYDPEEMHRAEMFALYNELQLRYVDVDFEKIKSVLSIVMRRKCAPVHSIEPQLYIAAMQAKIDGVECLIIGDAADYVFYGMDGLLSKDWLFDEFIKRAMYINPSMVLKKAYDITYVFEKYRQGREIDFVGFYDKVITEESYDSYDNAFSCAQMPYVDPYECFKLKDGVDLERTRNGDSKYYIRRLFKDKYPSIPIPEKHPMPRPVDIYFKNWIGPTRSEFREIDIMKYSGNEKWLLWCLEQFLDEYDPE